MLLRQVQARPLQGHRLRQVRRRSRARARCAASAWATSSWPRRSPHLVRQGHAQPPRPAARHLAAQPGARALLRAVHHHPRRRGRPRGTRSSSCRRTIDERDRARGARGPRAHRRDRRPSSTSALEGIVAAARRGARRRSRTLARETDASCRPRRPRSLGAEPGIDRRDAATDDIPFGATRSAGRWLPTGDQVTKQTLDALDERLAERAARSRRRSAPTRRPTRERRREPAAAGALPGASASRADLQQARRRDRRRAARLDRPDAHRPRVAARPTSS